MPAEIELRIYYLEFEVVAETDFPPKIKNPSHKVTGVF